MLDSIKKLKRHWKVTLNVFVNKKLFDNDKKIINRIDSLCKIEILLNSMKKLFKILGFSVFYSDFLFIIPGFSSFVFKYEICDFLV